MKKMGPIKTIKTLSNSEIKKAGFDCPGCAWPDPEHPSHLSSVKMVQRKYIADEAMGANVDRSFFAKYSVEELSKKSDYWLNSQGRIAEPMYLKKNSINQS